MTQKQAELIARYEEALARITRYKHTPRAYRHTKFQHLIDIAEEAIRGKDTAE